MKMCQLKYFNMLQSSTCGKKECLTCSWLVDMSELRKKAAGMEKFLKDRRGNK